MGTVNVYEHKPWVESVIRKYVKPRSIHYEDLVQEGFIALAEAARTFDESRGVKFLTYATPAIHQRAQRYLRRSSVVHMPDIWSADRRTDEQESCRPYVVDAAGRALDGESDSIEDNLHCGLLRFLAIDGMHSPALQEELLAEEEQADAVRQAVSRLPPRLRRVVERVAFEGLTFRELAKESGYVRQRMQQLYAEAVALLRADLGVRSPSGAPRSEAA